MVKLSRDDMWNMSVSIAKEMHKEGYKMSEIEEMDKFEMSKKFDERIKNMPEKMSLYDGKDYEEDDCFDYFKQLVLFQLSALNNPNK